MTQIRGFISPNSQRLPQIEIMFKEIVAEKFFNSALSSPDRNAFCINDEYFSYSNFVARVAAIAKLLEQNHQNEIALIANDDLDTYAAIFAIWFTGKMYVPLNPDTPAGRNQNVIDQVGIKTTLRSEDTSKLPSPAFEEAIVYLQKMVSNAQFTGELAYIFFTSGSTGVPKGVMITKENVAAFADAFEAMGYDISEQDRCLQMFELTFDLSVMSFLIPLLKGACVYTIPKGSVKYSYIFELMDEKELTVALMVPSILNYLRPYFDEIDCPKMRYSLFCGEALHEAVVEEWAKCLPNARIDNVYGPTEDTIFCTSYTYNRASANDAHNGVLSIGKSMKNNLAVVFNEQDEPATVGETGELCLAGAQLSPGYFNNPELNQKMFFTANYQGSEVRFYRTGDLCRLRENGNIDYIGRKDFQAKIQGFRVELSEVEFYTKLATNNLLSLVALAVENKAGNHEIAVIFESDEIDIAPVKSFLASKLPSYMLPTQHYFVKSFPLNINGKVDRNKLKSLINI
jgi:D-alanine--poly(phosphoribitol) ligase subunit 1